MKPVAQNSLVWLITGCSSGLGRALAQRALASGDRVVATARDPDSLADLSVENCRKIRLDVTNQGQIQEAVAQAVESFGRLDVIVNNAGYGLAGAFEELSEEQIARNFEVNLFGAMRLIRAALPVLRAQKSGHIVNISAAAAISNYPGFSVYGAGKCALEGISESLAAELGPLGIKVTIVEPGPLRTKFLADSLEYASVTLEDYVASSGRFLRTLKGLNGKQPGDPEKAAGVIIEAVRAAKPPLRLVLGRYAVEKTRQKLRQTERELGLWQEMSGSADFSAGAPPVPAGRLA
jgi:NAD(P)-dependent dehydrogenase (short-subunit alcohol dehydrogenase family)